MRPSPSTLDLSNGMTETEALKVVQRFAPRLYFHQHESHLPSDPDNFRRICRFRESRPWPFPDRGWNKQHQRWESGDQHGVEYHNMPWNDIVHESLRQMGDDSPLNPSKCYNLRPRDERNLHGRGNVRGLFLQRAQHLDNNFSGLLPEGNRIVAPIFVDFAYDKDRRLVKVLYWFFYELNWNVILTHEGDWEHISLLFDAGDFQNGNQPIYVYFAQHDEGLILPFEKLQIASIDNEKHPVIYVNKKGHPCSHFVEESYKYTFRWDTWLCDIHFIPKTKWRDFAGAWGEIGSSASWIGPLPAWTTGPLGPLFKRHRDHVKVIVKNRKPYVKLSRL